MNTKINNLYDMIYKLTKLVEDKGDYPLTDIRETDNRETDNRETDIRDTDIY